MKCDLSKRRKLSWSEFVDMIQPPMRDHPKMHSESGLLKRAFVRVHMVITMHWKQRYHIMSVETCISKHSIGVLGLEREVVSREGGLSNRGLLNKSWWYYVLKEVWVLKLRLDILIPNHLEWALFFAHWRLVQCLNGRTTVLIASFLNGLPWYQDVPPLQNIMGSREVGTVRTLSVFVYFRLLSKHDSLICNRILSFAVV